MNPIEVLSKVKEILEQCEDREEKLMCAYCPMKKYCEYLEKNS